MLPLLVLCLTIPQPPAQDAPDILVCMFEARVDDYARMHRELEKPLPAQIITDDPARLYVSREALRAEIRRVRAGAGPGQIFTPEIAAMFRRIVDRVVRDNDIDLLSLIADDEGNIVEIDCRVNADYPAGGPVCFMPPQLLKALPPLPPELQYRFANLDLILWDVHAGLIVDIVPNVVRRTTRP